MKLIIAGGRDFSDMVLLRESLAMVRPYVTEVVSGCARGADTLGEFWAEENRLPVHRCPADWDRHGRERAGKLRNAEMAAYGDALVAFWDGRSDGTLNMISLARAKGIPVNVIRYTRKST